MQKWGDQAPTLTKVRGRASAFPTPMGVKLLCSRLPESKNGLPRNALRIATARLSLLSPDQKGRSTERTTSNKQSYTNAVLFKVSGKAHRLSFRVIGFFPWLKSFTRYSFMLIFPLQRNKRARKCQVDQQLVSEDWESFLTVCSISILNAIVKRRQTKTK